MSINKARKVKAMNTTITLPASYRGEQDAKSLYAFINSGTTIADMDIIIDVLRAYRVPQAWINVAIDRKGEI